MKLAFVCAAWSSLGFVAYATLSPIELRPVASAEIKVEHIGAYAVIGTLFGLAYPRRLPLVLFIVLGSAALLEAMQHLVPDRHGRLVDLVMKLVGGGGGVGLAATANAWLEERRRLR